MSDHGADKKRSPSSSAARRSQAAIAPYRFKKGMSGNPKGSSKAGMELRELARSYGPEAIERLVQLMRSKKERVAIAACQVLLDRGYGRPIQAIAGPDGEPLMPQVLVGMLNAGPISDAAIAAEAYRSILGATTLDLEQVKFEPPVVVEPVSVQASLPEPVQPAQSIPDNTLPFGEGAAE